MYQNCEYESISGEKGERKDDGKKHTVGYQMGIFVANLIFDDKKNLHSFLYLTCFQISFLFHLLYFSVFLILTILLRQQ